MKRVYYFDILCVHVIATGMTQLVRAFAWHEEGLVFEFLSRQT